MAEPQPVVVSMNGRPQLDSARRIGLKSHPHEILTVVGDGGINLLGQNSENRKGGECFQWRSDNQWSYRQTEATAEFSALNMSKEPPSRIF